MSGHNILEIIPQLLNQLFLAGAKTQEDKLIMVQKMVRAHNRMQIVEALDKYDSTTDRDVLMAKLDLIIANTNCADNKSSDNKSSDNKSCDGLHDLCGLINNNSNSDYEGLLLKILVCYPNLNTQQKDSHTILILAAKYCKGAAGVACLKSLIAHGAKLNIKGQKGRTPIMFAIERCCSDNDCVDFSCAQTLIDAGADINACDADGNTALTLVIQRCDAALNPECIKFLIQRGAKVDEINRASQTALAFVLLHKNCTKIARLECIEALIEYGANVNYIRNGSNYLATTRARCNLDVETSVECAQVLIKHGINVNYAYKRQNSETTLIQISKLTNDIANLKYMTCLIKGGADVNLCNDARETALMTVARYCDGIASVEHMTILIENGANVNDVNMHGETALTIVAKKSDSDRCIECLRLLFAHGAKLDVGGANCAYVTAPHKYSLALVAENCEKISSMDCAKILIENGADIDAPTHFGRAALTIACERCYGESSVKFIKWLIESGANLNLQTAMYTKTPLMVICNSQITDFTIECTELLLQAGADPNLQDKDGMTALMYSCQILQHSKECKDIIVRLLILYGANYELFTKSKKSVFSWLNGCPEHVEIIKAICGTSGDGSGRSQAVKSATKLG